MTLKPVTIFGLFKVASSIVITMNLECKSVPKEEIFPITLKYNDVTRCTHTDLVLTIIGTSNTSLSDSWNGFHAVHNVDKKHIQRDMWSGERLTKVLATTGPDKCRSKFGPKLGKPLRREKNKNGQTRSPNLIMLDE